MLPGISPPGSTGVIFVMDRAMANGFSYDDHTWSNFGQDNYKLHIDKLKANINQMGLSALFSSNLRTPTGQAVEGAELEELIQVSRNGQGVILDEFYKRYNLNGQLGESLSAAKYYKGPLLSLSTYQIFLLDSGKHIVPSIKYMKSSTKLTSNPQDLLRGMQEEDEEVPEYCYDPYRLPEYVERSDLPERPISSVS
ncbi:hypothetical protein PGT21_017081 [Puccinia graminis f. sp. tritici]|uniref:Uncharacterized protein n=1 Tax=Puccinia graminis f. sp. tritici TaxID=56615 RepID=A0A5B0QNE5_PUCGR|nr:hypothetical protein PGT21_017081 [Puccinia graminis f. sp. tritici]